jgi:hypothetical protein
LSVPPCTLLLMGDFVATLVIDGKEFDLGIWDRPAWFAKDNIDGFRIVPDTEFHVTDALAAFALGAFDDFQAPELQPVDVNELAGKLDLASIRNQVRELDTSNIELILQPGENGNEFVAELKLFKNPIKVTVK